ncbi:MAG: methionyl-tRNA formyltransferase [Candidatus Omnitrophica bacterium]|nr:methionyl-tRNA formyltransferase [Candidatus Omnitrophota bacterium]MBU4149987.1 methionyl-tRNA formyltransferase [Candidatus Omnitrophota bacterium]
MNIVFFGSSDFAVPVLEALNKKENVALAVTQPDREKGRLLKVASTAVKQSAVSLGIETYQPENVNKKDSVEYLRKFDADVFVVVSFGQILKKGLLDIPKQYCLNVHASLLPKYRGAAPINWVIANGEKETGVTIIKMNEKMDEGDISSSGIVSISADDDAITLSGKLSRKGAELLLKSIELIKEEKISFQKQDSSVATCAPKLEKQDGLIDWDMNAEEIHNRVRAFVPWPGCFTLFDRKILKIWKVRQEDIPDYSGSPPGTVLEIKKNGILVSTGKGGLEIEELQLEGKRRMSVEEFIAGHKEIAAGKILNQP